MIVSSQWSEVGNLDCCQRDEDSYIRSMSYRAIGMILLVVSGVTEVVFGDGIILVALYNLLNMSECATQLE